MSDSARAVLTPFELGYAAFGKDLSIPALDKTFMSWVKENTSGAFGSGFNAVSQWYEGWDKANAEDLRSQYPDIYGD